MKLIDRVELMSFGRHSLAHVPEKVGTGFPKKPWANSNNLERNPIPVDRDAL
jgi:hypothetical protein